MNEQQREALMWWHLTEIGAFRAFWRENWLHNGPMLTAMMWANMRLMSGLMRGWHRIFRRRRAGGGAEGGGQ